jgi:seryl-tRNA synthetase
VVTHHEPFKIILSSILHNKQLLQKADKSITTDNIEPDELSRKLYESLAREYNKQIEKANTLLEEADEKRSRAENMYQGAITTEEHDATTRQKNDQLREEADTIKKEAKKIQEEAHEILKAVNNIPQSDKVPISKINKKKLPNSFTGLMIMIKAIPHLNDKEYIVAKIYPE